MSSMKSGCRKKLAGLTAARENFELVNKVKKLELDLYIARRGLQSGPEGVATLKAAARPKVA